MGTVPEGLGLLILTVILVVLTGLSVLARFIVRAKSKAPFAADDWWVLASVISSTVPLARRSGVRRSESDVSKFD